MRNVIKIGQFRNGSFGSYARGAASDDVLMYYAVEGDRHPEKMWGFASPHKEAVDQYARQLDADDLAASLPTMAGSVVFSAIMRKVKVEAVAAYMDGDVKKVAELKAFVGRMEKHRPSQPLTPEMSAWYSRC